LNGPVAGRGAAGGRDDGEVGAARVEDPLAVAAKAGLADGVVLVERDQLRAALPGDVLADDVGGGAVHLADEVDELAVGAPHRGEVLAAGVADAAVVGAVGGADPQVVAGGAAVALAVPAAVAADVDDLVALGREDAVLGLGHDAALLAAVHRHDVERRRDRVLGAAVAGEED